jgi:hypothetical protein
MRAVALVLLCFLGLVSPVAAGEATGVEIVEFGLYTADVAGELREPNGIVSNVIENICHIATTTTVPMRPGVLFGMRYRVEGSPAGEIVDLTMAVQFPTALQPSGAARPVRRHERQAMLAIGTTSYTGYSFDQDWEFVPGNWTLEVFQGGRKLAEKSFTVVDAPASSGTPSGPPSCFKVSFVILSGAKDLGERSDAGRGAGVRSFAALRTTKHG